MKVIKRNGREVEYDRDKIILAIQKANKEVAQNEKVSDDEISSILTSIENQQHDAMQVEEIQDMIEQHLMEKDKFVLAKTYIVYRYTREPRSKSKHNRRFYYESDSEQQQSCC